MARNQLNIHQIINTINHGMNNYIGFGVVNTVKESNEVPNTNINMDSNKCKFLLDEFYKCNT